MSHAMISATDSNSSVIPANIPTTTQPFPTTNPIVTPNGAPAIVPGTASNTTTLFPSTPVETIVDKAQEFFPPSARLWLYGLCVAALPLLVAYGKLSGDQVSLWTDFAASVLGVSGLTVAIANVKK